MYYLPSFSSTSCSQPQPPLPHLSCQITYHPPTDDHARVLPQEAVNHEEQHQHTQSEVSKGPLRGDVFELSGGGQLQSEGYYRRQQW